MRNLYEPKIKKEKSKMWNFTSGLGILADILVLFAAIGIVWIATKKAQKFGESRKLGYFVFVVFIIAGIAIWATQPGVEEQAKPELTPPLAAGLPATPTPVTARWIAPSCL